MDGQIKLDIPMKTHSPPLEGNFCEEQGNTVKPAIVQDYNRHMEYVDKSECMKNSYPIGRWTWN